MKLDSYPPETIAAAEARHSARYPVDGDWSAVVADNEPEAVAYCQLVEFDPAVVASAEARCDTDGRRANNGATIRPWIAICAIEQTIWVEWDMLTDGERSSVEDYHERESFMPMFNGVSKAEWWDANKANYPGYANPPYLHNQTPACITHWVSEWIDAGSPAG